MKRGKKKFIDQMGREVEIPFPPLRIISLVPSQTELLFDLGLDEEIVGITWFCIHPAEKIKEKTKIGGTKNLKLEKIRKLKPDLIIANKEENEKEQIELLTEEFPVWISDIYTLGDATDMIRRIGEITGKETEANAIATDISGSFHTLPKAHGQRVLYLIWKGPYMAAARHTFIDHMLGVCGFQNACAQKDRYPELDEAEIAALKPDIVFLSSEPYPFKEEHLTALQELLPLSQVMLVDGEMFSWYGSRLLKAKEYLESKKSIFG